MMKNIQTWCFALLASLFLTGLAAAQAAAPRVSSHLTTGVAKLGAPVEIIVVVEGSFDGRIGKLPAVDGLVIGQPQGPSTERSMRSIGGRISVELRATWHIPIKATRAGDFEVPSFTVTVGKDAFQTQPMQLRVREDLAGAELGYMQLDIAPQKIVVGQPFDVTLTFGWDAGLAAKINHADLSLPWWGEVVGAIEIESSAPSLGGRRVTVSLNGAEQLNVESLGRQNVDGRDLVVYRLTKSYLATAAGGIDFPVSHLEFGRVSSGSIFESPRVIEMYYKSAPATRLEVAPLPEAGRPIEFSGAVGTLVAHAKADRRDVDLGDSIKLEVTWSGDGNLEFFDLPDLAHAPAFRGLRLFGVTDKVKSRSARVSVFDLAPTDAAIDEIPPVPLVVFDPEAGRYLTVETAAIPIRVHALEGAGGLEELESEAPRDDIRDLVVHGFTGETGVVRTRPASALSRRGQVLGVAFVLVLSAFALLRPRLRHGLDPAAPAARRRRRALARLERELRKSSGPAAQLEAFAEFLAARTGSTSAAWKGRRLAHEPDFALPDELGISLDRALGQLEEAAWGASSTAPSNTTLVALARDLTRGGL
jgi:hypothetical protein